jgi:hypothetical protein
MGCAARAGCIEDNPSATIAIASAAARRGESGFGKPFTVAKTLARTDGADDHLGAYRLPAGEVLPRR